jgi:hypothetical protein
MAKKETEKDNTISNFITPARSLNIEYQSKWSLKDMEVLYNLRTSGIPYHLIASKVGRTVEGCRKKFTSTDWEVVFAHKLVDDNENTIKKQEYFQQKLDLIDAKNSGHKIAIDVLSDCITKAVQSLPVIKLEKYVQTDKSIKKHYKEEDVMLMLSDIHIGSDYSLEETGGISEFNMPQLNMRFDNLKYAVRDIYNLHSHLYKMPVLHIACLGDVVAGDNSSGEWSPNYISSPIVEQVVIGYSKIRDMMAYWLSMFDNIIFYGIRGNHGRVGKKGVEKDYSNFDYLCYKFLEESFKNNPRIKFVVPKTWWLLTEIKKHKFLMVHGDDIRSGSFPIKQLSDFESKMTGILKQIPNYTLAGHFHSAAELSTNQGSVIINGSFMGGDIYSLKTIHSNNRPQQIIFGINETRGKTWKYNIDLDDKRNEN